MRNRGRRRERFKQRYGSGGAAGRPGLDARLGSRADALQLTNRARVVGEARLPLGRRGDDRPRARRGDPSRPVHVNKVHEDRQEQVRQARQHEGPSPTAGTQELTHLMSYRQFYRAAAPRGKPGLRLGPALDCRCRDDSFGVQPLG